MTEEYDKNNSGVLFKNEGKALPVHSDYSGELHIDGAAYQLSGWLKKSVLGKQYLKLKIRPKKEIEPSADKDEPFF